MTDATCSVDQCELPVKRRQLCYGHYMKQWRYGSPTPNHAPSYADLTGQRFGLLTALRRVEGKWECQCDCGQSTLVRVGDLNRGSVASCGSTAHRLTDAPRYTTAHARVTRLRGSASEWACVDCQGEAAHWSYDHADTDELQTPDGHAYSKLPAHYEPRCVPCHKRFDLAQRRPSQT